MEYTIENEYLIVTVTTWGAQVKSVIRKYDDVEHMWQADKSVWGYHAPILFPHAGKVVDTENFFRFCYLQQKRNLLRRICLFP